MSDKNEQAAAPGLDTASPISGPTSDTPRADRHEGKKAADTGEDTSILPAPDEEGSALEEIDDSLVRAENS